MCVNILKYLIHSPHTIFKNSFVFSIRLQLSSGPSQLACPVNFLHTSSTALTIFLRKTQTLSVNPVLGIEFHGKFSCFQSQSIVFFFGQEAVHERQPHIQTNIPVNIRNTVAEAAVTPVTPCYLTLSFLLITSNNLCIYLFIYSFIYLFNHKITPRDPEEV